MRKRISVYPLRLSLLLLSLVSVCALARGQSTFALGSFPPRDVRVLRQWLTSQTLRLRFEPSPSAFTSESAAKSVTYLLAGASNHPPRARLTALHLYRVRGNQVIGQTYDIPASLDPQTAFSRISDLGVFRQYRIYAMNVTLALLAQPLLPYASEFWYADYLEFEIDLGPPPTPEHLSAFEPVTSTSGAPFALPGAMLLNADLSPAYYVTSPTQSWINLRSWSQRIRIAGEQQKLFKIQFYQPGLYLITKRHLQAALTSASLVSNSSIIPPASAWRVFAKGQEVAAVELPGQPDNLVVVVPQWDVDEEGPTVYWLDVSGSNSEPPGRPPARLTFQPASPAPPGLAPASVACQAVFERLEDYQARIRPTSEVSKWYWKSVAPETIETFTLELPNDYSPLQHVELTLYAALSHPRLNLPQLELVAHGDTLATAALSSVQGAIKFLLPREALSPGANEIGLRLHYVDESMEEKRDLLVQKFVLSWQQLAAPVPSADFVIPAKAGKKQVFDFTTASLPMMIVAVDSSQQWATLVQARGLWMFDELPLGRTLRASALEKLPSPSAIELASTHPLTLLKPREGADYMAIIHPTLREAARPLLARRAAQGFHVAQINVNDVFDLFGYGQRTSQAIRNFLSYAFYEWPAPKPLFVVLIGEASAYRRDPAQASPKCQLDMIPTGGQVRTESVHGDHVYACVAGTDTIPDLLVGRLSVATPDELTSAIAKLIRYEEAPAGEWADRVLFVTDDNEEFPRVAADVVRSAAAPPLTVNIFNEAQFPYVPNPRVYGKRHSREATRELLRTLDSGLVFVNYFGHGGPNLWSHERLLHILDLPSLREPARLPLIACASCDNAWLDYPVPPVKASMGEIFVKQPQGGAVAVFAPVSGATPYEHQGLMVYLLEAMTRTPLRSVGELATYAKINYYAQTLSAAVPEQYLVVGDPALRLKIPQADGELAVEPRTIEAGRLASLQVRGSVEATSVTSATLRLYALSTDEEILSRPVAVINGRAAAVVTLESPSPGTYGALLEYAIDGAARRLVGRFDVVAGSLGFDQEKLLRLASREIASTETIRTVLSVFNPTALEKLDALVEAALVPGASRARSYRIARDTFALAPGEARDYLFDWSPDLPQRLTARWARSSDVDMPTKFVFDLPRACAQTSESFVAPYGAQISTPAEPTEFDSPTFVCEIWNVGRETSRDSLVTLFAHGEPVAQSQLLANLSPGAKRQMTFVARSPLPAGETTVTLLVQRKDSSTSETDHWVNLYERSDCVQIKRAPELEIVPGSVTVDVPPNGIIARTSVRIRALLRNNGDVAARNARIQLMLDDPTTGTPAVMLNDEQAAIVPEVSPQRTLPIEARWENCNQPGTPRLWLVLNGARTIKERDYANNVALVPPFRVRPLGDIRMVALDFTPRQAAPGTTITIQCGVASDADISRGPLDVELGLRNPFTGQSQNKRVTLEKIPAETTATVSTQLAYDPDFTEVYAIANASKELEESDAGGNEQSSPIWPILTLNIPCDREKGASYDLSIDFSRAVCYNVEWLPGPALRLKDTFTSSTGMVPVAPDWAVGGSFVTKPPDPANDTDNKWSVAPWLIEAGRMEKCGPLQLRIPVAPWIPGVLYDVYVYALCSNNYKGGRVGRFTVAVEDHTSVTLDFRTENPSMPVQRLFLGRIDLRDGYLNISLEQVAGNGVVIKGVAVIPAVGYVDSPVYRCAPNHCPLLLKFADNTITDDAIQYWVRQGHGGPSEILWGEWRPVAQKRAMLNAHADYFQWRALLYPNATGLRPTLRKVLLTRGE
ncbi:MAG: C25 family cysteine peptidase [Candidatus Sumerlaeaceae bacterium]